MCEKEGGGSVFHPEVFARGHNGLFKILGF